MTNKKLLENLYVPRSAGDGVCFNDKYMDSKNVEKHSIYNIVSNIQRDSGLSFDFSYTIGNIAVDILTEVDWNNDDAINDAIDQAVPIYTHEIMEIYEANSFIIDEACEEYGNSNPMNSEERAIIGWYHAIQNMVMEIISKLGEPCAVCDNGTVNCYEHNKIAE